MTQKIENKQYFFLILAIVVILTGVLLWPVKDMLLVTWVIVVLFMPIYHFLVNRWKLHKMLATFLTVTLVLFTILVPVSIFINVSINQFQVFYQDINAFLQGGTSVYDVVVSSFNSINTILEKIPYFEYRLSIDNVKLIIQENISPIANALLGYSVDVGLYFATSFPYVIIFLYMIWYAFPEYDRFLHFIKKISPLPERLDELYLQRATAMIVGIAKGTFTIALVQGTVAGLSFLIAGIPYTFFWTIVMIFISIVPLGTSFVTVPVAAIMLATGNIWQAVFLMVIQYGVTSNLDNILRPMLIPKEAEVHPALLLLAFIGGIQVFGTWGFIYGPLIMVFLLTTVEVYQRYYKEKEPELKG